MNEIIRNYATLIVVMILTSIYGCKKDEDETGIINDADGNIYHAITIGIQTLLIENLKTTKYNDGTPIPNVTSIAEWSTLSTGAYCNYNEVAYYKTDDMDSIPNVYGRLYNWYAVASSNPKNVCPVHWHVPSKDEWDIFISFLGGLYVAGGKLKEAGTSHWNYPNTGATNESGFTAIPAGFRTHSGSAYNIGYECLFWSSTEYSALYAIYEGMGFNNTSFGNNQYYKNMGLSVRCIKD